MNAKARTARQIIKARRAGNEKRCLSTYVARFTKDATARETVTNALRKAAKTLREIGALGRVQTVITRTADGARKAYRYTRAQVALAAALYKPRKAEYKKIQAALAI